MKIASSIQLILIVGLICSFSALHLDSLSSMVALWSGSAYSHCYIVPLISFYFLWRDRQESLMEPWQGSYVGAFALLVTTSGLAAAQISLIQLLEHIFFVASLSSLLWCIAGDRFMVKNWFPLLFLGFCVPTGDTLVPVLQAITADLCTAGLSLLGIPAYREGMIIQLTAGQFEVARACSGFRYLNAGLALGAVLAYSNFRKLSSMALFIAFVIIVFVFMNGLRAFITILVAAVSDMQYMTGEDHIYLGYVFFIIAIFGVYKVASRFGTRWTQSA